MVAHTFNLSTVVESGGRDRQTSEFKVNLGYKRNSRTINIAFNFVGGPEALDFLEWVSIINK